MTESTISSGSEKINTMGFWFDQQDRFYDDRPAMKENNQDIFSLVILLTKEIEELNGHAHDGLSLEEYRRQEIADIGWFAFGILKMIRRDQLVSETAINVRAQAIISSGKTYAQVKQAMMAVARRYKKMIPPDKNYVFHYNEEERDNIANVTNEILAYTWALFFFINENKPLRAMGEKMARNMVKHMAWLFPKGRSYEDAVQEANTIWKKDRPYSTQDFYELGHYASTEYDSKEVRGWNKPIQYRWYEKAALNIITYLAKRSLR